MVFFAKIRGFFRAMQVRYTEIKQRGAWRFVLNKYTYVSAIFLLIVCVFDTNNLGVYIRTQKRLSDQKRQIRAYQQDIKSIEKKLQALQSDRDTLETFAREEYLYHEEGEDVFYIDK